MFNIIPEWLGNVIVGTIFALYFFIPLLVFSFIQKNTFQAWIMGASIPLVFALLGGGKYLLVALSLSIMGWLLAQIVLLVKKQVSK
ncbi:MAG: hypothetical protein WC715_00735 [Patescibacteria group bacterium]